VASKQIIILIPESYKGKNVVILKINQDLFKEAKKTSKFKNPFDTLYNSDK